MSTGLYSSGLRLASAILPYWFQGPERTEQARWMRSLYSTIYTTSIYYRDTGGNTRYGSELHFRQATDFFSIIQEKKNLSAYFIVSKDLPFFFPRTDHTMNKKLGHFYIGGEETALFFFKDYYHYRNFPFFSFPQSFTTPFNAVK